MISFAFFASVACLVSLLYIFIDFYWKFYKLSDVPGPFCFPFVTHATKFFATKDLTGIVDMFSDFKKLYGEFYKTWFGPKLFFCVSKPEYLKVILNHQDCLEKGSHYKLFSSFLGTGLVSAPVDIWTSHRKMINPTFSQILFTSRLSKVNESAENLIEVLKRDSGQSDILNDVTNCLLDVIMGTMFQFESNALKNNESICQTLEEIEKIAILRVTSIWLQPDFLFRFSELYKETQRLSEKFASFALNVFKNKISSTQNEFEVGNNDKYFFPHLLKHYLNNELTKKQFVDHIKTIIIGGTETGAVTICFSLIFLAMHEEIQEKMYEEIIETVGDGEITVDDLSNLKYTECVIKETLRLTPPGLSAIRKTTDNIKLGKHTIPKNSEIVISIMDVHRDAKYWRDPLKFDPDRFLPENSSRIYPYSFLPFLAGPRNCIGQKQAMISTKIILSHIVRAFHVKTSYKSVEEITFLPHMVTRPKDGFKINLEKRF